MSNPVTRDFTRARPPVNFTLDGETFNCQKALPLEAISKMMSMVETVADVGTTEMDKARAGLAVIDKVMPIFKIMLKKESYRRFYARFNPELDTDGDVVDDEWEPIDAEQVIEIMTWLAERYTSRPTEPSSNSSAGSETGDGGASSTAGARVAALNPAVLKPIGS